MQKLKNGDRQIFDLIVEAVKVAGEQMGWVTKEDIKHLPTKDEYFEREDKMMRELKEIRESVTILNHRTINHSNRIEKLEKLHPQNSHINI